MGSFQVNVECNFRVILTIEDMKKVAGSMNFEHCLVVYFFDRSRLLSKTKINWKWCGKNKPKAIYTTSTIL